LNRRLRLPRESGLILVVLGAIVLPALLLGYVGLRAIESEKLAVEKRVENTSRREGQLLVKELDQALRQVERSVTALASERRPLQSEPAVVVEALQALERQDPMIAQVFLVASPDRVIYPSAAPEVRPVRDGRDERARKATMRRTGRAYFLSKVSDAFEERIDKVKRYSSTFKRKTKIVAGMPLLFSYIYVLDMTGERIAGLLGFQVDLEHFTEAVWAPRVKAFQEGDELAIAILDDDNRLVLGPPGVVSQTPVIEEDLEHLFDDWRLVIFPKTPHSLEAMANLRTKIYLWMISVLLLTLIAGAYVTISTTKRVVRLARLRSDFVSNVSHELRTPLTSIRMFGELLLMGRIADPEEQRRCLQIIARESERLSRLIDNVLNFAKIERGVKRYELEHEEMGAIVGSVVEAFKYHAEEQGFAIKTVIQENLPEVKADADAISQVLFNLLSNAIKYSDKDTTVEVRVFQQDSHVVTEVADQGIGIDARDLPRIFEDFYRADQSPESERPGTGLGLTLARHIARAHGGDIVVESEKGKGSTFSLVLPIPR
jgi:signal transduction histidine kinase